MRAQVSTYQLIFKDRGIYLQGLECLSLRPVLSTLFWSGHAVTLQKVYELVWANMVAMTVQSSDGLARLVVRAHVCARQLCYAGMT